MRSLVNKEADRMLVNCHFEDEVWRSARLDIGPHNSIVVTVNQSLIQVKNKNFLPDHVESVSGDGRQRRNVIFDGFMLLDLKT